MSGERNKTLLLVDDETNILKSLNRLFRREGYTIFTANSGPEGIELLNQHDIAVILSDQRMPNMSGTEFLKKAKEIRPNSVRIVLSGYTDIESITTAINEGSIFKFLTKPWDDDQLKANIREAFELHSLKEKNEQLNLEISEKNKALKHTNDELRKTAAENERLIRVQTQALQMSQAVFARVPVGLISIDSDLRIQVYNETALTNLALEFQGIIGFHIKDVFPANLLKLIENCDSQLVSKEQIGKRSFECHVSRIDMPENLYGYFIALMPA